MRNYLEALITEKGRELDQEIEIVIDGTSHFGITYETLVEYVAAAHEYHQQIRNMLVKIDFKNGDVFHYLDFLAKGMIAAQGY